MAKSKSGKRKKIIVFAVLACVITLAIVGLMLKRREGAVVIQKEKVTRRNVTELVVANGKIQPVVQVTIAPEVSGEIIALPAKEGQFVNKGDVLVKIKPDDYIAARNSAAANDKYAVANQDTAQANLERAQLDYQRNQELFKDKLISDTAFLEAKTTYGVAKATLEGAIQQVEVAQAALDKADSDLSKTTIYSPLAGTVTKLNSQVGERVVGTAMMAGTEVLTVSDLNEIEARVDVGEIDVVLIGLGQKARLEVDAFKDRKFSGIVTEIANSSENNTEASGAAAAAANSSSSSSQEATKFEIKIRVTDKEAFRPGMSVTAEIETRSRTNVLTVPIQSVTTRLPKPGLAKGDANQNNDSQLAANDPPGDAPNDGGQGKPGDAPKPVEVVFLVTGDRVKAVPVKRGISDDNYVEIVDGLQEGQDVVSGGYKAISRELDDGKKVMAGVHASDAKTEGKGN